MIPIKRKLDLEQQIRRQNAQIDAQRQVLISRGLSKEQVANIELGKFAISIDVNAPTMGPTKTKRAAQQPSSPPYSPPFETVSTASRLIVAAEFYEVEDLKVELGQQVTAGQALAILANHQSLYVKGHAFKKEASRLALAAENSWEIDIEFTEDNSDDWPEIDQVFQIHHLSNTTDPNSRTFDFFVTLSNQSRVYKRDERPFVIWRFRPGQRAIVNVPVEKFENVLVLPEEAVATEGPQSFVFHQSLNFFNRIPVKILYQDRYNIVIENDGTIGAAFDIVQNSAASLNRILKSRPANSGELSKPGFHVHADGTVHKSH